MEDKMDKHSKRNRSKDNPYILNVDIEFKIYTVEFVDVNQKRHRVEVSEKVYQAFDEFELDDISQIHKFRKHIEHSEVYDESLFNRALNVPISVEEQVEQNIMVEQLKCAINQLSEVQKRRIKMYYFDDMKLREIAEKEGCSIMSVKDSINIGLKKLEQILQKFKN